VKTDDGKIIEERSGTIGRRDDDGTCLIHHQICKTYDKCLDAINIELSNKVNRWVIISLTTVALAAVTALSTVLFTQIDALSVQLKEHNNLIREIAVKQGAVMATQTRIIEQIKLIK